MFFIDTEFMFVLFYFFQIKLKEIFETPSEISLVLELVTGGELFERLVNCLNGHTHTHPHSLYHSSVTSQHVFLSGLWRRASTLSGMLLMLSYKY